MPISVTSLQHYVERWRDQAASAWDSLRRRIGGKPDRTERLAQRLSALSGALLAESGEYASSALAREALSAYQALDAQGRCEFFDALGRDYSPSPEAVASAARAYQTDPSADNLIRLQQSVEAPRQELFRRLNMAPGGTATLVEMRGWLLKNLKENPQWRIIDSDLMHLLRSWFNRGFLRLERIDWRTSAAVLEKLIRYEAVHAIDGWRDLHRRLEADRRCFAFFHPQLPDEPIIFIEVALTEGMAARVQPLLDVETPVASPVNCDCAMFYSITNCHEGLRGISFGNFLIKQVAEELRREFPQLRRFATLSPSPGFRRWLDRRRSERLKELAPLEQLEQPDWHVRDSSDALQRLLMQLCAYYLLHAKQAEGGHPEPVDPVARFHLGNGAALERLNWMGDTSQAGMARSAGLMVNYVYRLNEVERNHERYFRSHAIAASPQVEKLARECLFAAASKGGPAA
ncbi:MAG TPA: malonyl-CoA decarboxylase [Burkholderiales bacterium]|nr:malonyl-CoA decarboxylase [Burkholderiales bacterium]